MKRRNLSDLLLSPALWTKRVFRSQIRGKLYFLLSAAFAAVGRAATLPLVQRQYRDTNYTML